MLSRQAPLGRRAFGPAARALNPLTAVALCVAAALAPGCGADEDEGAGEGETATELTLTLDADGPGGEPERSERIVCEHGGDGCSRLEGISREDFEPVRPDTLCTQIYGGADLVTIEGTLDGEPVSTTVTRENGCEIDRFDRFSALLRATFPDYEPGGSLAPPG